MTPRTLAALLLLTLGLALAGCGPKYVKGTKIEYTAERQALANIVERYRVAVEQRDGAALRAIASSDYYENGSTTTDPEDDYGNEGLQQVTADLSNAVKEVRYALEIEAIEIVGDAAYVDLEYTGQYLYTVGEQDRWETVTDKNRLTMRREGEQWRIVSGM